MRCRAKKKIIVAVHFIFRVIAEGRVRAEVGDLFHDRDGRVLCRLKTEFVLLESGQKRKRSLFALSSQRLGRRRLPIEGRSDGRVRKRLPWSEQYRYKSTVSDGFTRK